MKHQGRENLKSLVSFVSAILGPTIKRISYHSKALPFKSLTGALYVTTHNCSLLLQFAITVCYVFYFSLNLCHIVTPVTLVVQCTVHLCTVSLQMISTHAMQHSWITSRNSMQCNVIHTTQQKSRRLSEGTLPTYLEHGGHIAKTLVCGNYRLNYNKIRLN